MSTEHVSASVRIFLLVLALVLFLGAAIGWPAPIEPYRVKIVAGGLFCWCLSQFF